MRSLLVFHSLQTPVASVYRTFRFSLSLWCICHYVTNCSQYYVCIITSYSTYIIYLIIYSVILSLSLMRFWHYPPSCLLSSLSLRNILALTHVPSPHLLLTFCSLHFSFFPLPILPILPPQHTHTHSGEAVPELLRPRGADHHHQLRGRRSGPTSRGHHTHL